MDSDDSAASEVASEPGDDAYDESFADEVADSEELPVAPRKPPVVPVIAEEEEEEEDAYEDDEFEAEAGYSVDFEEEDEVQPMPTTTPKNASKEDHKPTASTYSAASFEDESQPVLSIRAASAAGSTRSSPRHGHVRSPMRASAPPPPPPPVQALSAAAWAALQRESDQSLSLLLRKMESKYQDELESAREQNALLTWRERELKTALRLHREERAMRKSRLDKKRARAGQRRREHDALVERLHAQLLQVQQQEQTAQERAGQLETSRDNALAQRQSADDARRVVEERNLALAERLQHTLSEFHALTTQFEQAVQARVAAEQQQHALQTRHATELELMTHKAEVELRAVTQQLASERTAWAAERDTLPERHRVQLAMEQERVAQHEAQLAAVQRARETQLAQEQERVSRELASARAEAQEAQARAEAQLQEARQRMVRERESLDAQRHELVVATTCATARLDEERGRVDAQRDALATQRRELDELRIELDARRTALDERAQRLDARRDALAGRQLELTRLAREIQRKAQALAAQADDAQRLRHELTELRQAHAELLDASESRRTEREALALDKAALDKAARQLQHERLQVAKQRVQSRQFLDGARRLERLLQQQRALDEHGSANPAAPDPTHISKQFAADPLSRQR